MDCRHACTGQLCNGLVFGPPAPMRGGRISRMNASARVLVVDDDSSVRALLREYLQGHGFEVAEADSGPQMRERIEHELPDAVLLDVRLPGEDGLVLARY